MPGRRNMLVLGALTAALSCASAFQAGNQKPLIVVPQEESSSATIVAGNIADKPLVDSEELQAKISQDNLLARAKELYEIAKLSEDEYNHPTRVIGSAGRSTAAHITIINNITITIT